MIAFKEIQLQLVAASCGSVDVPDLAVAAHGGVNQETIVIYADFYKQRPRSNQAMEVWDIAEFVQPRSNLATTEI